MRLLNCFMVQSPVMSVALSFITSLFFFLMNYFSAKLKSPELQYPTLKFEDVGGNEETLTVSTR